ncbi:MAG: hypothetical protein AABW51_05250 [Nanoarchaeota archaeon]
MEKRVLVLFAILLVSLTLISSLSTQDFKKEAEKATYYAKEYEAANINYAQFLVYLNSVGEDLNTLLKSQETGINDAELSTFLGEPKKTNSVLSDDLTTEVQVANPVLTWGEKIIYDGDKIQIRLSVSPILYSGKQIVYNSEFMTIFKDIPASFNLRESIDEARKLSNVFALDSNVQTANSLAEYSINTEKISDSYFQQNYKTCQDLMTNIFGAENLKSKENVIDKTYEILKKSPYEIKADLLLCDDCQKTEKENWIKLSFTIESNGRKIGFNLDQDISADQFNSLSINNIKAKMIKSNGNVKQLLEGGNYKSAYTIMKMMEVMYDVWDQKISDETDATLKIQEYADKVQFTSGLFDGYKLVATSFNNQLLFEKVLYREYESNGTEICTNNLDDNNNNKTDCQDSLCTGQVCGSRTINVTEGNTTFQKTIESYCISGICLEKTQNQSICGNNICEKGENVSCLKDCSSKALLECQDYPPIQCNGRVISKGQDSNGCPLEPVCLSNDISCTSDSQCTQPLCGKSECVGGECKVTQIDQCNQAQCSDGDEKTSACSTGEIITQEICFNGVWKSTGQTCKSGIIKTPLEENIVKTQFNPICNAKEDCASNQVCDLGVCTETVKNSYTPPSSTTSSKYSGTTFTGNVIQITGEPITINGITGIVGEQYPTSQDINPSTAPTRKYNNQETYSAITGVVENLPTEATQVVEQRPKEILQAQLFNGPSVSINPQGVKEEFSAIGVCKEDREKTEAQFYFAGSGDKFGGVSNLMEKYRENGIEWCDRELKILLDQRAEITKSFNSEFATWFFETYLPNNADNWESKRKAIDDLYLGIVNNQIEIARMMNCLSLKQLSNYELISLDYATSYGELRYSEKVESASLPGLNKAVSIISPSMQASIFLDKDFVKKELMAAMNAHGFPGSSETNIDRKINRGLTTAELNVFKSDESLKSLIRDITSNYKDGYLDAQVTFVDNSNGKEDVVYNIYVKANEDNLLVQPMPPEETPPVDAKFVVDYNTLYYLMAASEENLKETSTLNPPWKQGKFNVAEIINLASNWVKTQLRMNELTNSLQVNPDNSNIKDLFKKVFFLLAEN